MYVEFWIFKVVFLFYLRFALCFKCHLHAIYLQNIIYTIVFPHLNFILLKIPWIKQVYQIPLQLMFLCWPSLGLFTKHTKIWCPRNFSLLINFQFHMLFNQWLLNACSALMVFHKFTEFNAMSKMGYNLTSTNNELNLTHKLGLTLLTEKLKLNVIIIIIMIYYSFSTT